LQSGEKMLSFLLASMQCKETRMRDTPEENRCAIQVRLCGSLYERLENWRRSQPKIPARADALRSLLERALDEAAA
jgi:hypothetical protein